MFTIYFTVYFERSSRNVCLADDELRMHYVQFLTTGIYSAQSKKRLTCIQTVNRLNTAYAVKNPAKCIKCMHWYDSLLHVHFTLFKMSEKYQNSLKKVEKEKNNIY